MKNPTELTKEAKLNLIYRHTSRDYKNGGKGDARAILVFRNGTSLVPLTDLTEAEIADKLPYALHKESKAKEANKIKAAKTKATKAIAKIVMGEAGDREFDNLFENGDGDLVVTFIIEKAIQNQPIRHAIADWHGGEMTDGMPKAWVETFNRVMPTLN